MVLATSARRDVAKFDELLGGLAFGPSAHASSWRAAPAAVERDLDEIWLAASQEIMKEVGDNVKRAGETLGDLGEKAGETLKGVGEKAGETLGGLGAKLVSSISKPKGSGIEPGGGAPPQQTPPKKLVARKMGT